MPPQIASNITRRSLLGGVVLAGAASLGSCSSDGETKDRASTGNATPTRGGSFSFSESQFSRATDCDPNFTSGSNATNVALFDALVKRDPNFALEMVLAEEFEPKPKDASVWTIRVRKGVEFHDGKTLDIDDVIFTINRILNPKNPGSAAALMAAIDPKRIKKLDNRTARLQLHTPNSQLIQAFNDSFTCIVPEGFDPRRPIGTGPFKYQQFTPKQHFIGKRHPNYWRGEGTPYLDELKILGFSSSTAAVNALLSGQIDAIDTLAPEQAQQIRQRSELEVLESSTPSVEPLGMNCRKGFPFEDARVRKAFKHMIDREKLVDTVYGGYGAVGNDVGVFSKWDSGVARDLEVTKHDPARAKALLKEAGQDGMSVRLRVTELKPGMKEAAELIAEQAKQVGVTVKLDVVSNPGYFYNKAYFEAPLQIDYTGPISMYSAAEYYWLSNAAYNSTGFNNSKVESLFKSALKETGSGYDSRMRTVSQIVADEGPWIVWGRRDSLCAHKKKFGGLKENANGGLGGYRYWELFQS